jgi:RND superfamily putative drug exporter
VFQWGWFGGLIGLQDTYLIASPLPAIFFAVLFGLSMDYEVFLVSRIREARAATGTTWRRWPAGWRRPDASSPAAR